MQNWKKLLAAFVLFDFAAYTGYVIWQAGPVGFIQDAVVNLSSLQVLLDLAISMVFTLGWLVSDARKRGQNPWGYVVAAVFLGSLSPLTYLVLRRELPAQSPAPTSARAAVPAA